MALSVRRNDARAAEPVINREEVVAVLFAVYDIDETLTKIYALLAEEDDDGEEGNES